MTITPYKQTLTHSCLAVCFLMFQGKGFTARDEEELAFKGSKRTHLFYVSGIPMEAVKKFDKKIKVYVDNKYFASTLQKAFISDNRIEVVAEKITLSLIRSLLEERSIICHIDDHALGDYSHASHFIVLEKATEKLVCIIDPWSGKRKRISEITLLQAINDLKTHIKMCPILFSIET